MIDGYSYDTPKRRPMSLGGVWFDATMERSRSYSSDVPTYPVEKGFKISDAVLKNPLQITLKAVISEMPLTFMETGIHTVSKTLQKLVDLYHAAEPISLYTNSGDYKNLVIQSMTFPETTEMVNAVEVSITLKQIRITGNYEIDGVYEGKSWNPAGRTVERSYNPTFKNREFEDETYEGSLEKAVNKSYYAETGRLLPVLLSG